MNNKPEPQIDPTICPLCGRPNLCPMAVDPNAKACWCSDEKFPRELLTRVPKEADRKACICQSCLESYRKEISETSRDTPEHG